MIHMFRQLVYDIIVLIIFSIIMSAGWEKLREVGLITVIGFYIALFIVCFMVLYDGVRIFIHLWNN